MKRKISLFKNIYSNSKFGEEAINLMYSNFYKILRLNLKKDSFEEVKVSAAEKHHDKGYSHNFSEWAKNYAMTGNVYKDDLDSYLKFLDVENIKKQFLEKPAKYTVKYRRNINNSMRWVSLDLLPSKNFSEKNQIVYLYVYDIHDSLSKELEDTHFLHKISEAITKSYLSCIYINIEEKTSRQIYENELIKSTLNQTQPLDKVLEQSVRVFVSPEFYGRMIDFCNLDTLDKRLKDKKIIATEYIGSQGGFCRATFIPVSYDLNGKLKSVIYANRYVDGEIIKLRGQLETEKALVECLTTLSGTEDFAEANTKILKNICEFYNADRAYIFSIDYTKNTASNIFEWCSNGAESEISDLQDVELETFSRWIELFNNRDYVVLTNREKELDPGSNEYKLLEINNVNSLIVAPFYDKEKKVTGFMGIDEPKKNLDTDIVIRSAATYIMEEQLKQNYTEELYRMSYSDVMTKALNRAAYIRDMKKLSEENDLSAGILYADVNGLKFTNDTKGHEAGDELIDSAVSLLRKYFSRKKDSLYRIGGDEFVVISSDISEKEFQTVIANMKDELKVKWILSCGGAWFHKISSIDDSTKMAEMAMYKNKAEYYAKNGHVDRRK